MSRATQQKLPKSLDVISLPYEDSPTSEQIYWIPGRLL